MENNKEAKVAEKDVELEEIAKEVQAFLEEKGVGVQPFMVYTKFGIAPSARITRLTKQEDAGSDQPDGGEVEAESGATGSVEPSNS
jgi:hypothetical protein